MRCPLLCVVSTRPFIGSIGFEGKAECGETEALVGIEARGGAATLGTAGGAEALAATGGAEALAATGGAEALSTAGGAEALSTAGGAEALGATSGAGGVVGPCSSGPATAGVAVASAGSVRRRRGSTTAPTAIPPARGTAAPARSPWRFAPVLGNPLGAPGDGTP